MATIFLSYSAKGKKRFVLRLTRNLGDLKHEVIIDFRYIEPNEELRSKIKDLISICDVVILVVSKYSVKSKWVKWEIDLSRRLEKSVIPLVLDEIPNLPPYLDILVIDFSNLKEFDVKLAELQGHLVQFGKGALAKLGSLGRDYLALSHQMQRVFGELSAKIDTHGGGIVVLRFGNDEYLRAIKSFLKKCKRSFQAVLSGNYTPDWFFRREVISGKDGGRRVFTPTEKLEYLDVVNDKKNQVGRRPTRLMIFRIRRIRRSFRQLKPRQIIRFFAMHDNVNLYLTTPEQLSGLGTASRFKDVIGEDFALIDGDIVIKRNGDDNTIALYVVRRNREYRALFDAMDECLRGEEVARGARFLNKEQIIRTCIDNEDLRQKLLKKIRKN
jgi:hypothetical protein